MSCLPQKSFRKNDVFQQLHNVTQLLRRECALPEYVHVYLKTLHFLFLVPITKTRSLALPNMRPVPPLLLALAVLLLQALAAQRAAAAGAGAFPADGYIAQIETKAVAVAQRINASLWPSNTAPNGQL